MSILIKSFPFSHCMIVSSNISFSTAVLTWCHAYSASLSIHKCHPGMTHCKCHVYSSSPLDSEDGPVTYGGPRSQLFKPISSRRSVLHVTSWNKTDVIGSSSWRASATRSCKSLGTGVQIVDVEDPFGQVCFFYPSVITSTKFFFSFF